MGMKNRRAFTLVELLIVVFSIVLLLFILMPVLSASHEQSKSAVCLGNQKGLIRAWLMFAADHDDKLVNGNAHPNEFFFYDSALRGLPWATTPRQTRFSTGWM